MNKKILVCMIIVLIILSSLFYSRPIEAISLIYPLTSENLPSKVESTIFFSAHSKKELDVISQESLEKLMTLMENIKVWKKITSLKSYVPQFKETYRMTFYGEDNNYHYINILNGKYTQIDNISYRIIGNPDLSSFYNIIILDQTEGSLDSFYYDLIGKE